MQKNNPRQTKKEPSKRGRCSISPESENTSKSSSFFLQHNKNSRNEAILLFQQSLYYNNKPAFLLISNSILQRLNELGKRSYNIDPHTTALSFRCVTSASLTLKKI